VATIISRTFLRTELMRVLLTADELSSGIDRLAAAVRSDVLEAASSGRPLTVIGVLTGSLMVVADLIRRLEGPVRVSMVWASSYRGTATTPGRLDLRLDLLPDLTGQDVLVVDDIFDTGRTLEALVAELGRRGAARVRSLVLLRKTGRSEVAIEPDFVGFDIPDVFVVGYGLDFDGAWRHLSHVAALEPSDIDAARHGPAASPVDPPADARP
jgi:hypoxanthine phosphoribosyltransferase